MKRLISVLLLAFSFLSSHAQTSSYTPLDLDTSCYWIQSYYDHHGTNPTYTVTGEVFQHVEKDTFILGKKYLKIVGHPSLPMVGTSNGFGPFRRYNCYNPTIFLREDTITKKVYKFYPFDTSEHVLLNFDLSVGDTVTHNPPLFQNTYPQYPIDSINFVNYNGTNRRTYFASSILDYRRIEGIGANRNFPDVGGSEFGAPMFTLRCFVKNNNIMYRNNGFPVDSCYRKPNLRPVYCWPIGINDIERTITKINFTNNTIRFNNELENIVLTLVNSTGQLLLKENLTKGQYSKNLSHLPKGIYFIQIQSDKVIKSKKILVQ